MKTRLTIYLSDGTAREGTCDLPEHPSYDEVNAEVRPLIRTVLTKHDHIEHVYVTDADGERTDMFVDDAGQRKGLDRNDAATVIYRRNWMMAHPKDDPETLPFISGDAVLFHRRIWF